MTPDERFLDATHSYERWRASRIAVVSDELTLKHERLATSPFVLSRGSYYRFLQQFRALLSELADAPTAIVVGDLHVENFGTWRDREGRLAWGVNDLDEIDVLPYTIDLVRLATSAVLAIRVSHLTLGEEDACEAVSSGWRERLEQRRSEPFVLGGRHGHLYRLASEAFEPPERFERRLGTLPEWAGALPGPAARLLAEVTPWRDYAPTLYRRVAGVGSLGSRRIVAVGEVAGGIVVREIKEIPGPASLWLNPKRGRARGLAGLIADVRGIAADPRRRQSGNWVLRRLAADATRLELASLRRRHDAAAVLHSMGAEAANIHLCPHARAASPNALADDERARPADWLLSAARTMADVSERDHAELVGTRV